MLSEESERLLSHLIMQLIKGEQRVEVSRKCLCDLYEFHPETTFFSLCKIYPEELLPRDIKDFLSQNSVEAKDEDIYLLVRQYSSKQNGKLNYEDFCHLILPSTNEIIADIARSRFSTQYRSNSKVDCYLVEEIKIEMFKDPEFSLWKAFETLNLSGRGFITEDELGKFMIKYKNYIGTDDFDAFMRRVDIEADLAVSYNEFLEALIPLQIPGLGETRVKPAENGEKERENGKLSKNIKEKKEIKDNIKYQKEDENSESNENNAEDDKMDSKELEKSPRFKDPKEFTLSAESFETPEKSKGGKPRHAPNKKSLELPEQLGELFTLELNMERKLEFYRQNLLMM